MDKIKIENYTFKPVGVEGVYICDCAVFKAPFDNDGYNDYEKSSGKKLLEQWFKGHASAEIQEQFDIDLPTVEEVFSHKMLINSDNCMKEFKGKPIWWWTKSDCAGITYLVWTVDSGGGINCYYANHTLGFVPVLRRRR